MDPATSAAPASGTGAGAAGTSVGVDAGSIEDTTTADADQRRSNPTSATGSAESPQADTVVWFVVPVAMQAQGDAMSKGCWVRLYSGDNFEGRYVSVVGPASIPEMVSPYGTGMNNWESAVVGPNATVTTYDDDNYRSRNATLRANQRYADLDDSKLGLFDDIESMKVSCSGSPAQSSPAAQSTGSTGS
jgi:hypothetical protein